MKENAVAKTECVIGKVAETMQKGNYSEVWEDFWDNNLDTFLHIGKVLVLTLVIILVALFVGRLVRKVIFRAVEKVIRHKFALEDYRIEAVTERRDALGDGEKPRPQSRDNRDQRKDGLTA